MSEKTMCTHIPRVRVEVDHEGMDMSWLECVVCGNRLYVSDEPIEALRTQLQEAQEWIDGYKLERESMIAVGREQANELAAAIEDSARAENAMYEQIASVKLWQEKYAAAEERADRAEKRSQFNKDNHLMAEKEIDRLTAQVKEWYDKWVQATNDLACESEELDTIRRSSVRVDVLLRWMQSRSRVLSILGGSIMSRAGSNPGEQAKALLSWLTSVLSKRQARTTNTKGGRR